MEQLLHYIWKHKLFSWVTLKSDDGQPIEVIDVGLYNEDGGPDFFNAKIRIGDTVWAGNVELHTKSSDWNRHGHQGDGHYNNVILHVVKEIDTNVCTLQGERIPQIKIEIPQRLLENYESLLRSEHSPPCYKIVSQLPSIKQISWFERLSVERLLEKSERVLYDVSRTCGDWEKILFVTLSRNFGFSLNADVFEEWAWTLEFSQIGKHRDNLLQIESFFLGQAGFLEEGVIDTHQQDDYYKRLRQEYLFLKHKFGLVPILHSRWQFCRLRPQNFPQIRLSELAQMYHAGRVRFSDIIACRKLEEIREMFRFGATSYWQTHFDFGKETKVHSRQLQKSTVDLILINTIVPLVFAYGKWRKSEDFCDKALVWLEEIGPEKNKIVRFWSQLGINVKSATDSQALIQQTKKYCEKKDCLRCRFGVEYLKT